MDRQPFAIEPTSESSPHRASVTAVRRLHLIDRSLKVILDGTGPEDILPTTDIEFEPGLAAELTQAITRHDFAALPVASGLFGERYVWRMVRIGDSDYFAVLVERSTVTRRAARIARRFHLAPQDADLLRLTVGGYAPQEIAHRFGQDATAIDALRARLPGLLGCDTLREVVEMVTARRRDDAINVPVRFSELRRDLQQLSSL